MKKEDNSLISQLADERFPQTSLKLNIPTVLGNSN